jgi:hypothetical protein
MYLGGKLQESEICMHLAMVGRNRNSNNLIIKSYIDEFSQHTFIVH